VSNLKLRPRNYGTMNRLIARGVTHAVNDLARKKNREQERNVRCQENKNDFGLSIFTWFVIVIIMLFILGIIL